MKKILKSSKDGKISVSVSEKKGRILAGLRKGPEINPDYPGIWKEFTDGAGFTNLMTKGSGEGLAGAVISMDETGNVEYMAGAFIKDKNEAENSGYDVIEIPEGLYLTAETTGPIPECIHNAWRFITEEILQDGIYNVLNTPSLEVYTGNDENMMAEDYTMQIEVPVERT